MSKQLRGKHGCWTCRIRKKKCDEAKPKCLACDSLSVTCYGYGPKPDWMGDTDKEAAVLEEIKASTRLIPRRKPKSRAAQTATPAPLASKPATTINGEQSRQTSQVISIPTRASSRSDHGTIPDDTAEQLSSLHIQDSAPQEDSTDLRIFSIIPQDSALLMQFLDHTFPLQFPMYNPRFPDGGRGWLLTLLLHTAPLYHAVLALGAYHRLLSNFIMAHPSCRSAAMFKQAHHLEKCLSNVQKAIREMDRFVSNGRELEIGTAMSVVQLVFLEVFTDPSGNWRIHLDAAVEMYERATRDQIDRADTNKLNLRILRGELRVEDSLASTMQQHDASRFVGGTVLWLDILASVTAGSRPKLLSYHDSSLGPTSSILLEDIMGCRNVVMAQIGRIASLHVERYDALRQGIAACSDFQATVTGIATEIKTALTYDAPKNVNISGGPLRATLEEASRNIGVVTSLFAHAANIYLHLVLHGVCKLEALRDDVRRSIDLFRTQITAKTLPALVFPLYMLGCAALDSQDRDFVRDILELPSFVSPMLKHREVILPTLERLWGGLSTGDLTWSDVLSLRQGMLLV